MITFILISYHGTKANEPNETRDPNETSTAGISEKVTKYTITERKEPVITPNTTDKDEEKEEEADEKRVTFTAYIREDGDFRLERSEPNRIFIKKDSQTWRILPDKREATLIPDERKDFPIRLVKGRTLTEALGELVISKEAAFMEKHCLRKWDKTRGENVYDIYLAVVDGVVIEFACEQESREPVQITVTQRYNKITTYLYESIEEDFETDDELFEISESIERIEPKPEPEAIPAEIELKPVSGKKAWALGCAAPLSERNHDWYDTLVMDEGTPRIVQKWKDLLKDGWDTEDRNSLLESVEWLTTEGGHRKQFKKIADEISKLDEDEFKAYVTQYEEEFKKQFQILLTKKYYKEFGGTGILAWDYVRLVNLCRWGYLVGYITEEEAWNIILQAAEELRQNFDSWEEMGRNYLIGRYFWSPSRMIKEENLFNEAMMRLIEMPTSPWNMYPWDMEFEEEQGEAEETF